MKSNSVQRRFRSFLLAWLIRGPLTLAADPAVGPAEEPLRIQSVQADVGSITLGWTGGRPMYQVQRRSGVAADWVDVGAPTSETRMNVPLAGEAGQFRVVSDASARYEVVFDATWSAATHPGRGRPRRIGPASSGACTGRAWSSGARARWRPKASG